METRPETESSALAIGGLQQSLDSLGQVDLSSLHANELSSTLSSIIIAATSLRHSLGDNRQDESDGSADPERDSNGEEQSSTEKPPSPLPSNQTRPLHNDIAPRRKLSQPFIAPIGSIPRQEGDVSSSDTSEPPANSPLLHEPMVGPSSRPTSPSRERIRTLMSNAPKLGAKISRAVSNAAGAIHPSAVSSAGGVVDDGGEVDASSASASAQPAQPAMSRPRRPLLSGRRRDANPEQSWINAARDAFRIIDVNGDGYLQKEEVVRAISTMQDENSNVDFADGGDPAEMANKMMAEVDTDGDGQIDMDEFVEMMRKGQLQGNGTGGSGGKGGRAAGVGGLSLSYNHRMSQLARNVLLAHQKKIENSVIGDDLWMIHPMSNVHAIWDVLVSLLILLTVITMPLSIGWDDLNDAFFAMNLTVDFIFLLDVCKNFCTGFIDENDAVIMDAKVVRRNYLTGFFITDLCSSLPLDLILRAAGASDAGGAVTGTKQSLKMLKLLRMAKLFRLLRISRLFKHIKELLLYLEERLNFRISDGFTKLLRLGIGALVLGHWIGCFNFMLVRLHNFPEDSWVVYAGLDDKDAYTQWSWSFFKALAQMIMIGFETPPFTNASCDTASHWCGIEHWITLMCLYIGAVFYSLLISSISAVLQTASLASRQFEEKLTVIDDYMRSKKLPAAMREKVKDYFHLQHANGKLYNETEILDMVTPILRREIKQFNGRDITNKVPIFKSVANKDFAEEMTNAIEPTIAFNNEVIMRENTTGDEMYFINSGVVEIFVAGAKNSAYVAIGDGCYFGEVSLLLGVRRTASARTKTQCMLYKIGRARLLEVLQDFPEMAERMKKTAEGRVRRLEYYLDPASKTLPKEDEIDPEDSKTDLFGADADVVARDKAEAFDEQRRERYRGAPGVHGGPAGGGIRTTGLYSPVRRKAHQGGGNGGGGSRGGGLIRRNNFNARTVLPLTSTARRNDYGEMA